MAGGYGSPRIGVIKLGIKQGGNIQELDHFVVPAEVSRYYGDKPKEIDIVLTDSPIKYKRYTRRECICRGNGTTARSWDPVKKQASEISCPCDHLKNRQCHLVLEFMIPKVGIQGIFQISSPAKTVIKDVPSCIDHIQKVVGKNTMIPLIMRRVARRTMAPGGKRQTHYSIEILIRDEDSKALGRRFQGPIDAPGVNDIFSNDGAAEETTDSREALSSSSDPEDRPMESNQADQLNRLMLGKGLSKESRLNFFTFILGKKKKTVRFANDFLNNFDNHFSSWQKRGSQIGTGAGS